MAISPARLIHPKYRADIDGLRAIAVLSVIGLHAFPRVIRGGFIGVDIFFVISGFLISTIIFENLERNRFSLAEFYSRRARRIFPALILVLIASIAIGWFALLAEDYEQLGKHIAAGAGFASNLVLWTESGYFDNAAETKPLLHLWSLGIEEQFYIIWPLLLWAAWKRQVNLLIITGAIAFCSFALSIWKIDSDSAGAFYSPQTRFWELMLGSCLAYWMRFRDNALQRFKMGNDNLQSFVGIALVAGGIMLITREDPFPGWRALIPTFGAALIIAAGSQAWPNRAILANRVLVWVGLISYPLYLWHWPLLTFARIVESERPSRELRIAALIISVPLAWLTFRLVERPIRFGNNRSKYVLPLFLAMAIIGAAGYYIRMTGGLEGYGYRSKEKTAFSMYFENSLPEMKYFEATGLLGKYRNDCNFYDMQQYRIGRATQVPRSEISESCYKREATKTKALFMWGDSHAMQLYFGLEKNLPEDWQILIVASSGCPANSGSTEDSRTHYCQKSNWFAVRTIRETRPDVVMIAQSGGQQFDELSKLGLFLKNLGVGKVVIAGPVPHWRRELRKIIVRTLWDNTPERTLVGIDAQIFADNDALRAKFAGAEHAVFADLIKIFCNESGCLTRIGDDRQAGITTWDNSHLTPIASDFLARKLLVQMIVGDRGNSR